MNNLIIFSIICLLLLIVCLLCVYTEKHPKSKISRILKEIDRIYYSEPYVVLDDKKTRYINYRKGRRR